MRRAVDGSAAPGHTGRVIPFLVAEAIRRARRGRRTDHGSRRPTTAQLVLAEASHQVRAAARRPALVVLMSGTAVACGVYVALGSGYPGPVAPDALRWPLVLAVLLGAVGLARTSPATWSALQHSLRRARLALIAMGFAGAVSIVKVGLHDMTPGPVLPSTARWTLVSVLAGVAVALAARGGARR